MWKQAVMVSVSVLLAACASREPRPEYAPAIPENPFGYQEKSLGDQVYVVRFVARPEMPMADVEGYALRRASEIAVGEGMAGFDLIERDCGATEATLSVPDYNPGQKQVTLNSAVGPVSIPTQEPVFPGFTRDVAARACTLKVRLLPEL